MLADWLVEASSCRQGSFALVWQLRLMGVLKAKTAGEDPKASADSSSDAEISADVDSGGRGMLLSGHTGTRVARERGENM